MTAIVGVLNKHAVAIAADSAVTMGDTHKVVNSGNKIFTLSKYQPIGILTYSAADFMETPWEVIIKQYRKHLGTTVKDHMEEYVSDFINYLSRQKYLLDDKLQHRSLFTQIFFFYKTCFNRTAKKYFERNIPFKLEDPNTILSIKQEIIKQNEEIIKEDVCESFADYDITSFRAYAKKDFDLFFQEGNIPMPLTISTKERAWFEEVVFNYIRSKMAITAFTGLVFTGYGDCEIYPSIMSLRISAFLDGRLKFFIEDDRTYRISNKTPSCIAPYAQDDVIRTIMGGMYPGFGRIIEQVVRNSVLTYTGNIKKKVGSNPNYAPLLAELGKFNNDAFITSINRSIGNLMFDKYTRKLINTVAGLGKEDMANMAESFISLTSLIRRMSPQEETVGGPVDVAVISKGDGFVWINRKHYFKPEYNYHFFENYFKM